METMEVEYPALAWKCCPSGHWHTTRLSQCVACGKPLTLATPEQFGRIVAITNNHHVVKTFRRPEIRFAFTRFMMELEAVRGRRMDCWEASAYWRTGGLRWLEAERERGENA